MSYITDILEAAQKNPEAVTISVKEFHASCAVLRKHPTSHSRTVHLLDKVAMQDLGVAAEIANNIKNGNSIDDLPRSFQQSIYFYSNVEKTPLTTATQQQSYALVIARAKMNATNRSAKSDDALRIGLKYIIRNLIKRSTTAKRDERLIKGFDDLLTWLNKAYPYNTAVRQTEKVLIKSANLLLIKNKDGIRTKAEKIFSKKVLPFNAHAFDYWFNKFEAPIAADNGRTAMDLIAYYTNKMDAKVMGNYLEKMRTNNPVVADMLIRDIAPKPK